MRELPVFRVLGYQQSRPYLRVLRLPEETVEPSPVSVNADVALDRGFTREGWLVFNAFADIRGVPVPLEGRAFRVGRWWDCVPAPNPRTVWLANPGPKFDESAPTIIAEYDGVARRERARRKLTRSLRLEAAVVDGLIFRGHDHGNRDDDTLWIWTWESEDVEAFSPGLAVVAAHDALLAVADRDKRLSILDTGTRRSTPVVKPAVGEWASKGSFSPDGRWLALGYEEGMEDADGDLPITVTDPFAVLAELSRPSWTKLAFVDTATGPSVVAEGRFNDFATSPVWTADSRWVIFDAPYENSLFACEAHAAPPQLIPIVRRRGRPRPLIDVTAVTS
jgi:hypothetical protein